MDRQVAQPRLLAPEDELLFPLSKGAVAQYEGGAGAPRTLRLFHRDREIEFGDPDYFAFGEALAGQSRFRAGDAAARGGLDWARARGLIEQLIGAGVLRYADEGAQAPAAPLRSEERESPLQPAPCRHPATWDESERILSELAGRPIETGHIELVVPVFRVAHMYLDGDDRQLGEANVFPPALRLERPTRWRTCTYRGSRHQPERPMNVTALRAMRAHWRQMMAIVRSVADAYRARFPAVGDRGWTVGDIERMTVCAMALPTYLMMRRDGRVANGRLHPALSSAFRLTDGPRTALHNMVFAGFGEPARSADTPMSGAELHAYAERSHAFRTSRGVCAGPPAMIDDFLAVMLDGADPRGGWPDSLDPEVAEALGEIEPAIDYALTGLQAYCAVYSLFPATASARAGLRLILQRCEGSDSPALAALRAKLGADEGPGSDEPARRLAAYDDMYRQCGLGLGGRPPDPSLGQRLEAVPPLPAETVEALRAGIGSRLPGDAPAAALADWLARFIGTVQAALEAALEAQGRINALLGRPRPTRPFTGRDLATGPYIGRDLSQYRTDGGREAPFLLDEVAGLFGIAVDVAPGKVTILRSPGG